ncbi:response regulator [Neokomagataea thailandica]|uniref:Two component response regulator KdpE n=1 Tax=Neokomagataea tanensis NBRC 106556 TaxID=1223519 RepID=A0ABQ0QKZ8_9PROT|nr:MULTISPECIES: response regulator transcription factor [Neokomagataea]GBR48556.1 two component response regulator KdpE [Neokomagataea tanensis NBRC 106556]
MRILIVEDEKGLGSAVKARVQRAGHVTDWFTTLADARAALHVARYDFVLLDLGLRDGHGRELLREIRAQGWPTAVLITTAFDQVSDRIAGLSDGADDYIVKPFDLDELMARVDAVARRYVALPETMLAVGEVQIDLGRSQVLRGEDEVVLTAREWAVLELMARRPGAVCSREHIEDALYTLGEAIESNAIEVYVSRIRKKIGAESIRTVRGRGYVLSMDGKTG